MVAAAVISPEHALIFIKMIAEDHRCVGWTGADLAGVIRSMSSFAIARYFDEVDALDEGANDARRCSDNNSNSGGSSSKGDGGSSFSSSRPEPKIELRSEDVRGAISEIARSRVAVERDSDSESDSGSSSSDSGCNGSNIRWKNSGGGKHKTPRKRPRLVRLRKRSSGITATEARAEADVDREAIDREVLQSLYGVLDQMTSPVSSTSASISESSEGSAATKNEKKNSVVISGDIGGTIVF